MTALTACASSGVPMRPVWRSGAPPIKTPSRGSQLRGIAAPRHPLSLVVITTNGTPRGNGLLAAATGMGAVTLRVGDLDGMIRYYRDGVTLELLSHDGPVAVLGRGTTPIVVLEHAPELKHAGPRSAGLFHTAILFDTREA